MKLITATSVLALICSMAVANITELPRQKYTVAQTDSVKPISSEAFIHNYGNLNNFYFKVLQQKKATIAFLGGSITNMEGWRNKVMDYLQLQYPGTQFTFINAGIPSLGSLPHAFRLQRDVLDKGNIDLLFVESAVNDHGNGTTETEQRRSLEGIIRHTLSANAATNIIMMAFVDEDKIADYNKGITPLEIKVHEEIAKYYHLPFINLAEEITRRIDNKEFTWKDDFKNLHPSPFGQQLYYATIKQLLEQSVNNKVKSITSEKLPAPMLTLDFSAAGYRSVSEATALKGFVVDSSWRPKDSARTRPGFSKIPVLEGATPGATFEYAFEGTTVGLALLAGPDAGMLEYSIDNGPVKKIELYTRWSTKLHLPWYLLLADELDNKSHLLKATISTEHNAGSLGTACRIAWFLVNTPIKK